MLRPQTSQVYWHYVLVTMAPPAPCMLDVTVGLTDSNATAVGNTKVKVGAVARWDQVQSVLPGLHKEGCVAMVPACRGQAVGAMHACCDHWRHQPEHQ